MALNAEINVVSLIDVMMLLMVIFMITAPHHDRRCGRALPSADVAPLEPKSGLTVSVTKAGRDLRRRDAAHARRVPRVVQGARRRKRAADGVYVRADQGVAYGIVVRVLAAIHDSGISNVALVAEPEGGA